MTSRSLRLTSAVVTAAVVASLAVVGLAIATPAVAATCGGMSGCGTIPAACAGSCPTVEVSPARQVAADQWVTVSLSGFAPGDDVTVYYCSIKRPPSDGHPSACILSSTPQLLYPAQQIPIADDGTATAAVNVAADPPGGGNKPLTGEVPGRSGTTQSFYCDNDANPCAIEVVDATRSASGSQTPSPATTAVVQLHFLPASTGCAKADLVNTSSDFSIQALLPALAAGACATNHPAIALDTASDLDDAARALAQGNAQVLFTTDPAANDVQAILRRTGHTYTSIPIVATADVLALSASQQQQSGAQIIYSDNNYLLTPNMVAGLVTYNYSTPGGSDSVSCPDGSGTCSGLDLLNARSGFVSAQEYGAFDPSEHTGVTDELVSWLCAAPTLPYSVDGNRIDDTNAAPQTLTTSSYDSSWPIKSCAATDQLPSITSPSATNFALLSDPAQQAKYLRAFAPPPAAESNPVLGVAPMDWSQAAFFGFAPAALQNAAGQFVLPTALSVSKALAAAPVRGGVVEPDHTTAIDGAYPMPAVVYAVVRTGRGAAAADVGVRTLLSDLLGRIPAATLPSGYLALPATLQRAALAAVRTRVPSDPTGQAPGPATGGPGRGHGTVGGSGSSGQPASASGELPGGGGPVGAPASLPVAPPVVAPATEPSAASVLLTSAGAHWAVPALALLGLLAAAGAGGLRLWRRYDAAGSPVGGPPAGSGGAR